ncbi:kinesin, partial [Thraustotheca clavata]
ENKDNFENSKAVYQELLTKANEICSALDFHYRLEAEGDESFRIVQLDGKLSSIVWDKDKLESKTELLEKLAKGSETADEALIFDDPSLAITCKNLTITVPTETIIPKPDPFFEVRSNVVRLVGRAQLFVGYGISKGHTTSHVKLLKGMSRTISVYNSTGSHIASIAVDLLYELNKGKSGSSILSPRSLSTLTLKVHLKEITFIAGVVSSEGIYATYQLSLESINQSTKSCTPKVKLSGPSVFDLNHSFTTEVSCPNGQTIEAALENALISIDIWGWGDMIPISLTEKTVEIAQLRQKVFINTPVQSQTDASLSKPQALPIAAKIDVFISVDIEERNADGIYMPVSVKEDGSLRLQQGYARRVVVRAVQADHQYFCLSGITQVRLCQERTIMQTNHTAATALGSATLHGFFKQYSSEPTSPAKPEASLEERNAWVSLAFRSDSTVDSSSRSVSCVMQWDAISNERRCHRGERRQFRVAVALANDLSDVPVVLSKIVVAKICPVATTRKLLQRQVESAWWARESYSRSHRLGNWYAVELGTSRRLDPLAVSEINSNSLLAEKLLDHYGKGVEKLDIAMMLEKFRQQLLAETETITLLDAKETDLNEICKTKSTEEFVVREISDELFIERRLNPGIFVHVSSGALIDTTDDTVCDTNYFHIVTEPTSTDPYAGDMCGFLALNISNNIELPNSTSNWQRRWF